MDALAFILLGMSYILSAHNFIRSIFYFLSDAPQGAYQIFEACTHNKLQYILSSKLMNSWCCSRSFVLTFSLFSIVCERSPEGEGGKLGPQAYEQ